MPANYDNSAPFYDRLSKIIFGNALISAQVYLLGFIPANSSIIIIGGGTGWILREIARVHPSGLKITYVEVSSKMTALAKQMYVASNEVIFINQPIENVQMENVFDVVITPFLFDNFTEKTLTSVFAHTHSLLKKNGLWLCTDFQTTGKIWQSVLLKSMYLFFKIICQIETLHMPNIGCQFEVHNYKKLTAKTFFGKFIISTQYQKALN